MQNLHPIFQQALAPFAPMLVNLEAPPVSHDHEVMDHHLALDAAMLADKLADGYGRRADARAMQLQVNGNPQCWGFF